MAATAVGRAGREGATESWATIIAGNGNANAGTLTPRLQSTATTDVWAAHRRSFATFTTATDPLPAGSIITAATISMLISTKGSDSFGQSMCIVEASTGAGNADYQNTAAFRTEYTSRVTIASMASGVRSTWTFNAAGLTYLTAKYVAATSFSMGLRYSSDIDQSAPTWVSATTDDLSIAGVGATGPEIVVTYRVGPGHAVVHLTGTLGNSADTVNANLWAVEVFT